MLQISYFSGTFKVQAQFSEQNWPNWWTVQLRRAAVQASGAAIALRPNANWPNYVFITPPPQHTQLAQKNVTLGALLLILMNLTPNLASNLTQIQLQVQIQIQNFPPFFKSSRSKQTNKQTH